MQFDLPLIDPNVTTGTDLANFINSWAPAVESTHKGAARPGYASAGMLWLQEVSAVAWNLKLYGGTGDATIGTLNPTTSVFTVAASSPAAHFTPAADNAFDLGNAALQWRSIYLAANIIGKPDIIDTAGKEILKTATVVNAVNEVTVGNAITGRPPLLTPTGDDANISLLLKGKGTGGVISPLLALLPMIGGKLVASVAANALTIAIKTHAGNDPSATEPVFVMFRDDAATGGLTIITLVAATSFTLAAGSSLGNFAAGQPFRFWVFGFNDGGVFRIGAMNSTPPGGLIFGNITPVRDNENRTTTAEGGGLGVNGGVIYTAVAIGVARPMRVLGYLEYATGLAVAGQYATAPTKVHPFGPGVPLPGDTVQRFNSNTGTFVVGAIVMPADDTVPQITEGDGYLARSITPSSPLNALRVRAQLVVASSVANTMSAAIFRDATAGALRAVLSKVAADTPVILSLSFTVQAMTTAATTFFVRAGGSLAGNTTFNGVAGAQLLGGNMNSFLEIEEMMI